MDLISPPIHPPGAQEGERGGGGGSLRSPFNPPKVWPEGGQAVAFIPFPDQG